MDIDSLWEKAQKKTEVVRGRVQSLPTFRHARVPYVFLAESTVNEGHTVIRKGRILVEKPLILLPEDLPQFDGFDFEENLDLDQGAIQMFFLMRGMRFPSLKYNNSIESIDVDDRSLAKCAEKYKKILEKEENVKTALILGPEDCWQFSILLYMSSLIGRCAKTDIMNLMDRLNEGI